MILYIALHLIGYVCKNINVKLILGVLSLWNEGNNGVPYFKILWVTVYYDNEALLANGSMIMT